MQKIKQLSFVLFVFSVLAMSYLGTSAYAQEDIVCEEGQFDRSLACDPTTGTCCNQCDPGGACEANPHTVPCCEDWTQGGNAGLDPGSNRRSSGPAANAGLDPRINTGSSVPAANATFRKDVPIAKPGKREQVRPQKSGHMKQNVHANEGQRQKPTSRSRNQGSAMPSREGGSINNDDAAEKRRESAEKRRERKVAVCLADLRSLRSKGQRLIEAMGMDLVEQLIQKLENDPGSPLPHRCGAGFGFACVSNLPVMGNNDNAEYTELEQRGALYHIQYHEVYNNLRYRGCVDNIREGGKHGGW